MREIKFRGKRLDNVEWATGQLFKRSNEGDAGYSWCIADEPLWANDYSEIHGYYHVDPATIGQFTGLRDKNGVGIYEGDVIQRINGVSVGRKRIVIFKDGMYQGDNLPHVDDYLFNIYPIETGVNWEVIGNIHDNPELLEGSK